MKILNIITLGLVILCVAKGDNSEPLLSNESTKTCPKEKLNLSTLIKFAKSIFSEHCSSDYDCQNGQICCTLLVLQKICKDPEISSEANGACAELCQQDYDCKSNERCKSNGCGHQCLPA
ncbi:unnamed protein product [Brachionus calyciflorus]|uniref:WAP domain-containing protein n=1 Tax=Brachionus calyciflorus TaxID=104777 RepID=A0A813NH92_9BILA|nr:unnamed protein product [Brachionus calyciflorus]